MAQYYSEADYCAEEMNRPYAGAGFRHGAEGGERYVIRKEQEYEEIDEVARQHGHLGSHGASGHLGHSGSHHEHLGHREHHGHRGRYYDAPCERKYDSCTGQYYD